jgi:hypothetical protein
MLYSMYLTGIITRSVCENLQTNEFSSLHGPQPFFASSTEYEAPTLTQIIEDRCGSSLKTIQLLENDFLFRARNGERPKSAGGVAPRPRTAAKNVSLPS